MNHARGSTPRRPAPLLVLAAALVVVLGVSVWLALRDAQTGTTTAERAPGADGSVAPAATRTLAPPHPHDRLEERNNRSAETDLAADGLPYMPAGADAGRPDGAVHPHPLTARHLRIARENALLGSLSDAMDVKDVARLRTLLDTYRAEYPEDDHRVQRGYQAIAGCLEHPGADSRAAAQHYVDHELASTLRRFVKRHCLE